MNFIVYRKPQEDSELLQLHPIPELERIAGNRLPGQAMADLLMVFEFLHNFGETLGFGKFYLSSFPFNSITEKKTCICKHTYIF